jgi:hypothetical protein
LDQAALDYLT